MNEWMNEWMNDTTNVSFHSPAVTLTSCRYVDYLLVMAYNYHGSWNKFTGHHSGLFPRSDEVAGEREWNQVTNVLFVCISLANYL